MSDRGFIIWQPRAKARQLLDVIHAVLETYRDVWPITMRQIFYAGLDYGAYEKTEKAYKELCRVSRKARRSGLLDWEPIRDDSIITDTPVGFEGLGGFRSALIDAAENFRRNRQSGQPRRLIVRCETAGMVPQLARVCRDYGIPVQSAGGYDGVTLKHDLALEAAAEPTTILHLGDLDPSGENIFDVLAEDVITFVLGMRQMRGEPILENTPKFVRIAVTPQQVAEMNLPTAPPKETDSRTAKFKGAGEDEKGTVQCEAIPPNELRRILETAIRAEIDLGQFEANLAKEEEERQRAIKIITGTDWGDIEE